ncbi:MAG: hypothetical protein AAGJ82_15605 [Bacteroidota bacterium]
MKDLLLQRHLRRIEIAGNDDLLLIMEFGADAYGTKELRALLKNATQQKIKAGRWQHYLFLTGFSIPVWTALAIIAAAFEWQLFSISFLSLVPLSLLAAVLGHSWLRRTFPVFRDIHLVTSIIQQELERRRKDASIY